MIEQNPDSIEISETQPSARHGWLKKTWRIVWITALSLIALSLLMPFIYKIVNPPLTPLMVQRFFQQAKDPDRSIRFSRDYVDIDEISPNLVTAVIAAEDGRFMRHKGFDIPQLKQAYRENQRGKRVRGGSTISMQTAKNAFLPHSRNYLRKAFEAAYTICIEKIWGKKRIMEVYLNIIEFGDGIYGCEAASQYYFGHSAEKLSRREAALLAASLPSPLKRNPASMTPYYRRQTSAIENRMSRYGKVNLDKKPTKRTKEDDETIWDFLKWMRKQKK